ncbi:hypothetical protein bcere0022_18380 [Bacillus cereus Rock3-44]|nr:hypothetical protein bcere0022_18380 [Bacillus cereus Rock3-44]
MFLLYFFRKTLLILKENEQKGNTFLKKCISMHKKTVHFIMNG